jgi:hypothetical protein
MDQRGGTFPFGKKEASTKSYISDSIKAIYINKLQSTSDLIAGYRVIPLTTGILLFVIGGAVTFFSEGFFLTTLGVAIIWYGWTFFKVGLFGSNKLVKDMCTTETNKDLPVSSQVEWNNLSKANKNQTSNISDNLSDSEKLFLICL